jgi:hypothetical protein
VWITLQLNDCIAADLAASTNLCCALACCPFLQALLALDVQQAAAS